MFSDNVGQSIDWTLVDSAASANAFAATVEATARVDVAERPGHA